MRTPGNFGHLVAAKDAYLALENVNLLTIKRVWFKDPKQDKQERVYDDAYLLQPELPYLWDDPLYMKMIHRFRNCGKKICIFVNQIDIRNQQLFCDTVLRPLLDGLVQGGGRDFEELRTEVEFFAWLSNWLAPYEAGPTVDVWRKTPIKWFYELDVARQQELLGRFNISEIEAYNRMLTDRSF